MFISVYILWLCLTRPVTVSWSHYKGLKALNCLMYNTKTYALTPKVICQLFDTFVGSVLSYSCEVWGFGKCKSIERIHLKFCKALLKVRSSTPSLGVYGDLGRCPLVLYKEYKPGLEYERYNVNIRLTSLKCIEDRCI